MTWATSEPQVLSELSEKEDLVLGSAFMLRTNTTGSWFFENKLIHGDVQFSYDSGSLVNLNVLEKTFAQTMTNRIKIPSMRRIHSFILSLNIDIQVVLCKVFRACSFLTILCVLSSSPEVSRQTCSPHMSHSPNESLRNRVARWPPPAHMGISCRFELCVLVLSFYK